MRYTLSPGGEMPDQPRDATRRRPLLKRAIFGSTGLGSAGFGSAGFGSTDETDLGPSGTSGRAVTGTVLDASPHILVIATEAGAEERFALMDATSAWHGGAVTPASLRPGSRVVLRRDARRRAPNRVWA